jgi:hypothetical protein
MNRSKISMFSTRATLLHRFGVVLVTLVTLGIAQQAHAQSDPCDACSSVTGWNPDPSVDQTVSGNQSESVCNVNEVDGDYVESVVYNDVLGSDPNVKFTPTDRIVSPGASILGWSYRVKTPANLNPSWTHAHFSTQPGWPVLWSDPSVASNPGQPKLVIMGSLAAPQAKFDYYLDYIKSTDGKIRGGFGDNPSPLGGACFFRSTDGGQSFSALDCFGDTKHDRGFAGDSYGHFYDGSSLAIAQREGGSGFSVYAAFNDGIREAVWKKADVTNNDRFQLDDTSMGNTGSQQQHDDSLGEIDMHVRLLADGENLWKMSTGPHDVTTHCLNLNIRNRNSRPVSLACDATQDGWNFGKDSNDDDLSIRVGPQFAYDIGINENGVPEMRFVYIGKDGGYHLQAGYCPVIDAKSTEPTNILADGCSLVTKWRTPYQSDPMVFFPAIKFATDPVSNRSGWKVTFVGRTPENPNQLAVFAADLERPTLVSDSATLDSFGLVVKRVTPLQNPCPDIRKGTGTYGYWGDYDGMTFDPLSGNFVRSYTDSHLGCDIPRSTFTSHNVHVSTVEIPLRPEWSQPIPKSPLTGFQFGSKQEQVKYVNPDNHICELYITNGVDSGTDWHPQDLTQKTRAPLVAPESGIVAFETTNDNNQHVFFKEAEGADSLHHIWELVFSGAAPGWMAPNDLIDLAQQNPQKTGDVPNPKAGSPLAGYQTSFNGEHQLHVDYIDDQGYVQELWFDTSFSSTYWWHTNLWTDSGQNGTRFKAVNLVGYVTTYNNQQHVIYLGEDQNIWEFYLGTQAGSHWKLQQLTFDATATTVSPLIGYQTTFTNPNQEHVAFIDKYQHVIELVLNQGASLPWVPHDLYRDSGATSDQLARLSSPLTGYQSDSQQHIDYIDVNHRVEELVQGGGYPQWKAIPLTDKTTNIHSGESVPLVGAGSSLSGYWTTWSNQQHVVYVSPDKDVFELFYNSSFGSQWKGNNLTKWAK